MLLYPAPPGGYDYFRYPRPNGNQPPVQGADPRSRQQPWAHSYGQQNIAAAATAAYVATAYDDDKKKQRTRRTAGSRDKVY